jgi:hypothetical protein
MAKTIQEINQKIEQGDAYAGYRSSTVHDNPTEHQMQKETRQKIWNLMGQMDCPKHFICAKLGFEHLCKAQTIDDTRCLLCLEEDEPPCPFACVWFIGGGKQRFCVCPLRVYLTKKLGK